MADYQVKQLLTHLSLFNNEKILHGEMSLNKTLNNLFSSHVKQNKNDD